MASEQPLLENEPIALETAPNLLEKEKFPLENKPVITNSITKNSKGITKPISAEDLIAGYTQNEELAEALLEFLSIRKRLKAQNTVRGIKKLFADLDALSQDDHIKIQIVDQSICNGWKGVFELKSKGGNAHASYRTNDKGESFDQHGFRVY